MPESEETLAQRALRLSLFYHYRVHSKKLEIFIAPSMSKAIQLPRANHKVKGWIGVKIP